MNPMSMAPVHQFHRKLKEKKIKKYKEHPLTKKTERNTQAIGCLKGRR
jgi:hypothetical protein